MQGGGAEGRGGARTRAVGGPAPGAAGAAGSSGSLRQTGLSGAGSGASSSELRSAPSASSFRPCLRSAAASGRRAMRPAGAAAGLGSPARDLSLCGELLQAPPPLTSSPPTAAPSGPPLPAAAGATLNRLPEPLLRRLSGSLDRAPEGRGWRRLAEVAGSRGRLRLRCGPGTPGGGGVT